MALSPSSSKVAVATVLPSANKLRARVIPRFPANLVAGNGVTITKNGATYIFTAESLADGVRGDIIISDNGDIWSITPGAVTVDKLQNIAQGEFFTRSSPGVGPVELTSSIDTTQLLALFTNTLRGLVPPSGGGTTKYLRADGQFVPPGRDETIVALADSSGAPLDASASNMFKMVATANRSIAVPTNKPAVGNSQRIIIIHEASGGNWTLSLPVGMAGSFRFGSDITSLTATTSGKTDYIGAIYNPSADRWDVVSYVKGF